MKTYSHYFVRVGRSRDRAFTIIELLVVVAIIVLLIAILVPAISAAKASAKKTATRHALSSIQTGLNAYFTDFNMYPSSTASTAALGMPATGLYGAVPPGMIVAGRGPAMLAEGLMGYLPYGSASGNADGDGAGQFNPKATAASPDPQYGFRTRPGGLGKIYGPYASDDPKSYRVNSAADQAFIDPYGNEILYYCAVPGGATNSANIVIFADNGTTANGAALFNASDDLTTASGGPVPDPSGATIPGTFFLLLGRSSNLISSGSSPILGANSFLLISAGPDGKYFTGDDIVMSNR